MKKIIPILIFLLFASILTAQSRLNGTYNTPWGSELILVEGNIFNYKSFECYHLITAKGNWNISNDTLRLNTFPKAGYDSIISIKQKKTDLNSYRITLTDLNNNIAYFTSITAYINGKTINKNTDTLGYIDLNTNTIDSIRVENQKIIKYQADKENQNHIIITYFNVNIADTENFENQPFLIKGKKLFYIYLNTHNKKKYFKKK
ncbi:hypothetical protein [Brumimicrobium oceani]|uniref:Uncharacterized protein n=1 Tax=Brumimicrobium oceani TaxID=2100725 RepID=A0A2U2X5E7_9FLAO|nr:hypothetical protein [Brumimicrobium oceani]PWH82974.1 hypothetical protein DIT68_13855 [Brumimicrobium oceani]